MSKPLFEVRREGRMVVCDEAIFGCLFLAALGAQSALGDGEHSWEEMKGALLSNDGMRDLEVVLECAFPVARDIALDQPGEVK